jgi:hypothetical protein
MVGKVNCYISKNYYYDLLHFGSDNFIIFFRKMKACQDFLEAMEKLDRKEFNNL